LKNERKCRAGRSKGCSSKPPYEFPKENAKLARGRGWAYCRGGPIVEGGPVVGLRSFGGGLIVKGGPVVKGGPIVKERGYFRKFSIFIKMHINLPVTLIDTAVKSRRPRIIWRRPAIELVCRSTIWWLRRSTIGPCGSSPYASWDRYLRLKVGHN